MSTRSTKIGWTSATWNPVRGCSRVSPGCRSCYAMGIAYRFSGPGLAYEGLATLRKNKPDWTGKLQFIPPALTEPLHWKKPQRIFVNSMSDLFHPALPFEEIAAVFGVMMLCRQHTFQVLTKRPERIREFFAWLRVQKGFTSPQAVLLHYAAERGVPLPGPAKLEELMSAWPLPNVHLGVSVESQEYTSRIDDLLRAEAAIYFVSAEPLLGPLDLRPWLSQLDWVIPGGESGQNASPYNLEWPAALIYQCRVAGVPCFHKQLGANPVAPREPREDIASSFSSFEKWVQKAQARLDPKAKSVCFDTLGRRCARGADFMRARDEGTFPVRIYDRVRLKSKSGSKMEEWPEYLRVQQFPTALAEAPRTNGSRRGIASDKTFVVLLPREGHEPDPIWHFEAKDEGDARAIASRVIPEWAFAKCTIERKTP